MPKPHGSNIKTYNYLSLSFLNAKTTASLRVCFYQINATKNVQSCPIKMGRLWTKRDFVARKTYLKFPQIFSTRTVNICDMHKSDWCFWVSLDMLGEINFQSKLHLRASNFFDWKQLFRQKKKVEGRGDMETGWVSYFWGVSKPILLLSFFSKLVKCIFQWRSLCRGQSQAAGI